MKRKVVFILMAMQTSASAQSLGALLPLAVPGFAAAPGVTALSRLHRDEALAGIASGVGGLTLYPSIAGSVGGDTAPGANGGASGFAEVTPSLRLQDDVLGLVGYGAVSVNRYAAGAVDDSTDSTIVLGDGIPFGPDTLTLGAARAALASTVLGGAATPAAPLRLVVNEGRMAVTLPFGMFTAIGKFGAADETVRSVAASSPGFGGRTSWHAQSEVSTRDDGVLKFLVLTKFEQAHYRGVLPGSGFTDGTALTVAGGVVSSADAPIRVRLVAGATRQGFAAGGPESHVIPVLSLAVGWTPDGLMSAELTAAREAGLETSLGQPGEAVNSAELAIAEAYRRDLLLTVDIDARASRIAGSLAREVDVDAKADWHIARGFAVRPEIALYLRHDVPGSAPHEARATLALVWSP